MNNESVNPNTAPIMPLSGIYAGAEQKLRRSLKKAVAECPLPAFMISSIMESICLELKHNSYLELAADMQAYVQKCQSYLAHGEKKEE